MYVDIYIYIYIDRCISIYSDMHIYIYIYCESQSASVLFLEPRQPRNAYRGNGPISS